MLVFVELASMSHDAAERHPRVRYPIMVAQVIGALFDRLFSTGELAFAQSNVNENHDLRRDHENRNAGR